MKINDITKTGAYTISWKNDGIYESGDVWIDVDTKIVKSYGVASPTNKNENLSANFEDEVIKKCDFKLWRV